MMSTAVAGSRGARTWITTGAALLLLILTPTAAKAATASSSYGDLASFGSGLSVSQPDAQYNAVAVEQSTGNILVAEPNYPQVQVYAPDPVSGGVPLTILTPPYNGGYNLTSELAVDQVSGALYVYDDGFKTVHRFLSDGAPVPIYTDDPSFAPPGGFLFLPGGLAVDPVTHDVLVGDRSSNRVYRFGSLTGALVATLDGSNTAAGTFQGVGELAVGPTGTVYVVDDTGTPRVERFSSAGTSLGTLPISPDGNPVNVAVNSQSGDVAVVVSRHGQAFIEGFTAGGQPTFSARVPAQVSGSPIGLAWDSGSDRLYLDTGPGIVHTFVAATKPGLDPPIVSQVTATGAHIAADVARGGVVGSAHVEYCPATAPCSDYLVSDPGDASNPWAQLPDHSLPDPQDPPVSGVDTIKDALTGLLPNFSYRVRSAAASALTDNTSNSTTFHTSLIPPDVQTGLAGDVTDSQAVLSGTIATYADQTVYHFEYGQTTNYGNSAPAGAEGIAGNSRDARPFTRVIKGLQPGTTYHYRLMAHNAAGTAVGQDHTFTTQGLDQVAPGRGYEQVSPVDKRGATIRPSGFQAASDGSAIAYALAAASTQAASAPLLPRYLSRRGTSDWTGWQPLDPPLSVWRAIIGYATQAVSADFTRAMVVSNRALTPGAIDTGANVYIADLKTGAYTLVGSASGLDAYLSFNGVLPPSSYLAGAPDFSWILLASRASLLPGVNGSALYRWSKTTGLELVSRLPGPNGGSVPAGGATMVPANLLTIPVASDDGNTVYFSLEAPDAGVYRRLNGQTTAISLSQIPGDPTTPFPGVFDGTSSDGRYAFFRAGRLTPDAAPADPNLVGPTDLYRYDSVSGDLIYIGVTVSHDLGNVFGIAADGQTVYFNHISDTAVWHNGVVHVVTSGHPDRDFIGTEALASKSGRYLAYLEAGDVRLYDADADQSFCASCRADGSSGGTASLPLGARDLSNRAVQVVTDDGVVYFDTAVPIVSADRNGKRDVYSYRAGHLTLISPGDGNFDARFADATADGRSVFFTTDEPLVGQDTDQALDVYVARVGGGLSAQSPVLPASCAKTECAEAGSGPVVSPPVVAPPQPPGLPKKRSNQQKVTLSLTKVGIGTASMRFTFRASQQGRIKVTGSRVVATVRDVAKAGTYSITVPLSKKARTLRRDHKKFKVSVKVSLSGGWGSASAKYSRTLGK
jgi:hypothetical protein